MNLNRKPRNRVEKLEARGFPLKHSRLYRKLEAASDSSAVRLTVQQVLDGESSIELTPYERTEFYMRARYDMTRALGYLQELMKLDRTKPCYVVRGGFLETSAADVGELRARYPASPRVRTTPLRADRDSNYFWHISVDIKHYVCEVNALTLDAAVCVARAIATYGKKIVKEREFIRYSEPLGILLSFKSLVNVSSAPNNLPLGSELTDSITVSGTMTPRTVTPDLPEGAQHISSRHSYDGGVASVRLPRSDAFDRASVLGLVRPVLDAQPHSVAIPMESSLNLDVMAASLETHISPPRAARATVVSPQLDAQTADMTRTPLTKDALSELAKFTRRSHTPSEFSEPALDTVTRRLNSVIPIDLPAPFAGAASQASEAATPSTMSAVSNATHILEQNRVSAAAKVFPANEIDLSWFDMHAYGDKPALKRVLSDSLLEVYDSSSVSMSSARVAMRHEFGYLEYRRRARDSRYVYRFPTHRRGSAFVYRDYLYTAMHTVDDDITNTEPSSLDGEPPDSPVVGRRFSIGETRSVVHESSFSRYRELDMARAKVNATGGLEISATQPSYNTEYSIVYMYRSKLKMFTGVQLQRLHTEVRGLVYFSCEGLRNKSLFGLSGGLIFGRDGRAISMIVSHLSESTEVCALSLSALHRAIPTAGMTSRGILNDFTISYVPILDPKGYVSTTRALTAMSIPCIAKERPNVMMKCVALTNESRGRVIGFCHRDGDSLCVPISVAMARARLDTPYDRVGDRRLGEIEYTQHYGISDMLVTPLESELLEESVFPRGAKPGERVILCWTSPGAIGSKDDVRRLRSESEVTAVTETHTYISGRLPSPALTGAFVVALEDLAVIAIALATSQMPGEKGHGILCAAVQPPEGVSAETLRYDPPDLLPTIPERPTIVRGFVNY